GGRYYPSSEDGDITASLGILFDETYEGEGIKISEVITGGPLDNADSKIKAGDIVMKINGEAIRANENWNKYLNNITDKHVLLTVKQGSLTLEEATKPISKEKESRLMYRRWIKAMSRK